MVRGGVAGQGEGGTGVTAEQYVEQMRLALRLGFDTPEGDRLVEECDRALAAMPKEENARIDSLLEDMIEEEVFKSGRWDAACAEYGLVRRPS